MTDRRLFVVRRRRRLVQYQSAALALAALRADGAELVGTDAQRRELIVAAVALSAEAVAEQDRLEAQIQALRAALRDQAEAPEVRS